MSFDFYCTNCGLRLSQNPPQGNAGGDNTRPVLFDMSRLFAEERTLKPLQFRIKGDKLDEWLNGEKDATGYTKVTLTFRDVLDILSSEDNLDNATPEQRAAIQKITKEEFAADAKNLEGVSPNTTTASLSMNDSSQNAFSGELDTENTSYGVDHMRDTISENTSDQVNDGKKREIDTTEGTNELLDLIKANQDENTIKKELSSAYNLILEHFRDHRKDEELKNEFSFRLKGKPIDSQCRETITAGYVFLGADSKYHDVSNARVCPDCGMRIIPYAGSCRHARITFIGNQGSGKTSTILALTSMMIKNQHSLNLTLEHLPQSVEHQDRIGKDLENYERGFAPDKTEKEKEEDAYSVSFYITVNSNKKDDNKREMLLSLMDIPGEPFGKGNSDDFNPDSFLNIYKKALRCDGYVVCFDTQEPNPLKLIQNVRKSIKGIQELSLSLDGVHNYKPTIFIFTKYSGIESNEGHLEDPRGTPIDLLYMLIKGKEFISNQKEPVNNTTDKTLNDLCDIFFAGDLFNKTYYAYLCSSPYGYRAPKTYFEPDTSTELIPKDKKDGNSEDEKDGNSEKWKLKLVFPIPHLRGEIRSYGENHISISTDTEGIQLYRKITPKQMIIIQEDGHNSYPYQVEDNIQEEKDVTTNQNNDTQKRKHEKTDQQDDGIKREDSHKDHLTITIETDDPSNKHQIITCNKKVPDPKNIELLMNWILSLTGCLPLNKEYKNADKSNPMSLQDYYIDRAQLRNDDPLDAKEAMARCILFCNPSDVDKESVRYNGTGSAFFKILIRKLKDWVKE